MAKDDEIKSTDETKPLDPQEVRKAFGTLRGRVTRVETRLAGTSELVKRAQRIALSAERRADMSRLDAHSAEVKAVTCKLDMDNSWRFVQKALEDIVALSGRVKVLEDANSKGPGGDSGSGDEDPGD